MPKLHRPTSEIARQLAELKATMPQAMSEPPSDDFAASLQWKSWQIHLDELNTELVTAKAREASQAVSISGSQFQANSTSSLP